VTKTLTDANGIKHTANFFDVNLVNPWGVAESGGSPFWVSDNNAGVATLYTVNFGMQGKLQALVVSIPAPGDISAPAVRQLVRFLILRAGRVAKSSLFRASDQTVRLRLRLRLSSCLLPRTERLSAGIPLSIRRSGVTPRR
jgi:hypothetical protein